MAGFEPLNNGASAFGQNFGFFSWLASVRMSRIIATLLVVLVIVPLVTHHYLSKVAIDNSNLDVHHTRIKLDIVEEPGVLKVTDLKLRVEELLRIKTSVSNELIDLESKRQKHVAEISLYNQKIEELKLDVSRYQQELERYKLSVEQAKYAQKEAQRKNTPDLQAPRRILPSLEDMVSMRSPLPNHVSHCRMHLCFDHSRCSLISGFPVYYYNPEDDDRPTEFHLSPTIKSSVTYALSINPHITFDPHVACVFVVLLGCPSNATVNVQRLENFLRSLAYWQGDGRNHVLVNLETGGGSCSNLFEGVDTGRAMVVQTSFARHQFRDAFDIVVPPIIPQFAAGNHWEELPPYSPAHRKFLLTFQGELVANIESAATLSNALHIATEIVISSSIGMPTTPLSTEPGDRTASETEKVTSDMPSDIQVDAFIVQTLNKVKVSNTEDKFFFQFTCPQGVSPGYATEWRLCETAKARELILRNSSFSLIIAPTNWSLVSTTAVHARIYESLKYGAVPIFLGDFLQLPFAETVDWSRAALVLPKARVTELHFLIRTFTDADLLMMRRQGRLIWETYLSTTQAVVDTTIATLRTRLKIPPLAVREEPSPSIFNSSFVPLKLESLLPDIDPDESVGPTEPPYPSPSFRRNFTYPLISGFDIWNTLFEPFTLYPYTPFDSILPSEAKFLGSGIGFRPIGYGTGGSGKEFTEALGGNVPREQFTIVMLTYEREAVLINSLQRLYGLPHLNKVIVVWNSQKPPSEDLRWPDIGVPVHVIKAKKNSLNNRFLPYDVIETEAVLSVDDDAHLRHDEIMFGFRVWREARDRIVGFPGRYHAWDLKHGGWLYNSNYSCELSMVLTGAAFFHKYYAYLYSYEMPQSIRDKVDEYMNCEDIAMNFLVSHITRKPPLKVTSRWTFRCPGCPVALSEDDTHFQERHKCINYFVQVYGYMPLLNTQFRVDSVLFKTRLPHDKQKCFKFI